MSGTTSIESLPSDPQISNSSNPVQSSNINLEINERPTIKFTETSTESNSMNNIIQQKTMNQIVSEIQQAAASGVTNLPSRDIPMDQSQLQLDQQSTPNFIPTASPVDYIKNHNTEQQFQEQMIRNQNKRDNLDILYNELQIPILISLLFFLFNLPFMKQLMFTNLKFLFDKSGNYNLYGFIIISILFGISFYLLKTLLNHFSTF